MGTPDKAVTDNNNYSLEDIAKKINNYSLEAISKKINEYTKDGKLNLPEDIDPALKFAITAEVRRRDTQAEYTRIKQDNAIKAKKLEAFEKLLSSTQPVSLTEEQKAELDKLKDTDIDAWYAKRKEYEEQAEKSRKEALNNTLTQAEVLGRKEQEDVILRTFNANSPHEITREDLELNIPPRIMKAYESGAITFDEVLVQASNILFPSSNTTVVTSTNSNDSGADNDEDKLVTGYTSSFDAYML